MVLRCARESYAKDGGKYMQHSQNDDVCAMYVLKLIRVTAGYFHSFRIRSKESLGIMYPNNPVLENPPSK